MELIIEGEIMQEKLVADLLKEANEITAIIVSSRKSAANKQAIANRKSKIGN